MMKVTKNTFNEIAANRHKEKMEKAPKVQRLLKNGTWGKPYPVLYCGKQDPAEYMMSINPGKTFRNAE